MFKKYIRTLVENELEKTNSSIQGVASAVMDLTSRLTVVEQENKQLRELIVKFEANLEKANEFSFEMNKEIARIKLGASAILKTAMDVIGPDAKPKSSLTGIDKTFLMKDLHKHQGLAKDPDPIGDPKDNTGFDYNDVFQ